MFALVSVLPLAAQTEANDTAQFVVVYDYECRTQDRKGEDVTDKMQVAVPVQPNHQLAKVQSTRLFVTFASPRRDGGCGIQAG